MNFRYRDSYFYYIVSGWILAYILLTSFYFYSYSVKQGEGYPIAGSYDSKYEYIGPVKYFFTNGHYWPDYRMPGFFMVYSIFYFMTNSEYISNVLYTISSLIVLILGIFFTMDVTYALSKNKYLLHLVGFVWATNSVAHRWAWVATDVFTMGILALSIVSLIREKYLLAGCMYVLSFFMRPIVGSMIVPLTVYIWLRAGRPMPWRYIQFRPLFYFLLPFLFLEGSWIIRNYIRYKDFRPLSGNGHIFNESCNGTPARESYYFLMKLGIPTDNTVANLYAHGNAVDSTVFYHFLPVWYLKSIYINQVMDLLNYRKVPEEEKNCDYLLKIEKNERELGKKIATPFYVRLLNRIRLVIFGDIIYLDKAYSIKEQVRFLFRHPLHAASSITLVLILIYFPFAVTYSLLWLLLYGKVELSLSSLLLLGAGMTPILAHLFIGIVDHRYLVEFIPTFTLCAIASATILKSKKNI